jgi:hypothetical protein
MKTSAFHLSVAFGVVSAVAQAQSTNDPVIRLRPPPHQTTEADNWIVSETTSPVDYKPIVAATTAHSPGPEGPSMQLSMHCRGGRTELVVTGSAISRRGEDYTISYRINDDQPMQLAAVSPSFGTGAAFKGDVVRLLQSLPEEGGIAIRLSTRAGAALAGYFLLGGLKTARDKVSAACRWPQAISRPHN